MDAQCMQPPVVPIAGQKLAIMLLTHQGEPIVAGHPSVHGVARRQGDRIATFFAALRESASGTKRTCPVQDAMSAYDPKRTSRISFTPGM
jgi:hypothetical protein